MLAGVALALFSSVGCNKLRARDQLNKGVQSYKNAKYEEAINHFQQAVSLDPSLLNARLYLATAFAQQYIPGVDAEDNNRMGQNAIDQYSAVLERDPKNRYATARDFAWDLQHQDKVGVAARAELHNWKDRRKPRSRQVLFYIGLALIPVVIFWLLLYVAKHT